MRTHVGIACLAIMTLGAVTAPPGLAQDQDTATIAAAPDDPPGPFPSLFKTDSLRAIVLEGIRLTANEQFAEAESLFSHLAETYPESPIGPAFLAAAIHAEMLDLESDARNPIFQLSLKKAGQRAEKWREVDPESGEPEFIMGTILGYEAVYESRWGGWFAALKKGLSAKKRFAETLEKDSTLIDAYVGIGNYNYWKSVKTDFINWLPIVADDRQKGIDQLRHVAREGVFSAAAGRASLSWVLMNERDFEGGLANADTLRAAFPNAKFPLWIAAYSNFGLYRWEESARYFQEIQRLILEVAPGNYANLIECTRYEAQCLYGMGKYAEALQTCHRGLDYPASKPIRKQQGDNLDALRKLQKKIKKMIVH